VTFEFVSITRHGPVAVVELRRDAKLNAISTAVERELKAAITDPAVAESRCVVLAGSPRAFSAGADINEFRDREPASIVEYYRDTGDVYERVAALAQPTISAISGYCLGGGFELALATDLRIADESAVFGLPEVGIGIVPSSGGLLRLVRAVGTARAKDLVLRGRRLGAGEALELGLVTELVRAGEALPRALELGQELGALPPLALTIAKQAIDQIAESSRESALLIERLAYAVLAQTPEASGAVEAFLEQHRPPSGLP
jgi:enoyl-CoA hydratase/carnithine racemase